MSRKDFTQKEFEEFLKSYNIQETYISKMIKFVEEEIVKIHHGERKFFLKDKSRKRNLKFSQDKDIDVGFNILLNLMEKEKKKPNKKRAPTNSKDLESPVKKIKMKDQQIEINSTPKYDAINTENGFLFILDPLFDTIFFKKQEEFGSLFKKTGTGLLLEMCYFSLSILTVDKFLLHYLPKQFDLENKIVEFSETEMLSLDSLCYKALKKFIFYHSVANVHQNFPDLHKKKRIK
jgi:hypothetical protein